MTGVIIFQLNPTCGTAKNNKRPRFYFELCDRWLRFPPAHKAEAYRTEQGTLEMRDELPLKDEMQMVIF